jgi:hypothetical protein
MDMSERQSQQLHFDVMGIALAVRGHLGECALFHEIDAALNELDWRTMAIVQYAFEMLTTQRQQTILLDLADADAVGEAITAFERILHSMLPATQKRPA